MPSNPNLLMASPFSPSFNTLSDSNLADAAARVTDEEDSSDLTSADDFEFNLSGLAPILDGDSSPVYPVFDRDLLRGFSLVGEVESQSPPSTARIRLKNLFLEDPPSSSSSSSSEVDDLEQIPPGTYCVWAPNRSPGRCTKSSSTGSSSKAWNLRDLLLLKRSKSDGKDEARFRMFLTPKQRAEATTETGLGNGEKGAARGEKNKRKTYLPYRQDLVAGFCVSPHALRKATTTTTRLPVFR